MVAVVGQSFAPPRVPHIGLGMAFILRTGMCY